MLRITERFVYLLHSVDNVKEGSIVEERTWKRVSCSMKADPDSQSSVVELDSFIDAMQWIDIHIQENDEQSFLWPYKGVNGPIFVLLEANTKTVVRGRL